MSSQFKAEETPGIWVSSGVANDGHYRLTFNYGPKRSWTLDYEEGWRYLRYVATQIARCTYDAAVLALFQAKLGADAQHAAYFIGEELRPLRSAKGQVGPLSMEPSVTTEGKPFLVLSVDGKQVGQYEISDAREHLQHIAEAIETIALDSQLREVLVTSMGLNDMGAREFVHDLGDYR